MAGERNVALVASAGAVAAAAVSRAYMRIARPPKLCWHPDGDLERILLRCKALLRPYWPHAFSYGGISSSAAAAVKSIPVPKWTLSSHEELLRLADGGTVSLDWWQSDHLPADERPVALFLPGLNNSSRSFYVRRAMARVHRAGFVPVALNYRGVEHLELTSPRLGAADSWRDLPEVLAAISAKHPGAPIVAVGYSMGSIALARYLAEHGEEGRIAAGVLVSSPMKYGAHGEKLASQQGLSFLMSIPLKAWFFKNRAGFREHLPQVKMTDILRSTSLHDLLRVVMCPANGYAEPSDYFTENDPTPVLHKIRVPVLILNSLDDPLVGPDLTPYDEIAANGRLVLAETHHGGHLGWGGIADWWGGKISDVSSSWADSATAQFLHACLSPAPARSRL